jgi:hypothetical protein
MNTKLFSIFIFGLILQSQASVRPGFQFTFGATSLPLNAVTTSATAKKDFLGELYNPLGFKYNFESLSTYQWAVSLSTTKLSLITNKDKDKGLNTYMTQLGVDMFFNSSSSLSFKTQFGILQYEMKGAGGQTQLNNGTGYTTFDLPSKTRNSQILYFGGGAVYDFGSASLETSFNIASPFSNTRRTYFISLMVGVPL